MDLTLPAFLNALRILRSIDYCDLRDGGVHVAVKTWRRFCDNPFDFLMRCDDERAAKIWSIVEARQPKRDAAPPFETIGRCDDPEGPREVAPPREPSERDQLHGHVRALLGLLQLVRARDDVSPDLADVLRFNHRATDAAAYLTQIVPPEET